MRKGLLQGFFDHVGMLSCFGMCDMVGMCGMFVGDDEPSPPGTAEKLTHSLRAVRGLPSPGSGTGTDPFVLDPEPSPNTEPRNRNPEDPEGLFEDGTFPLADNSFHIKLQGCLFEGNLLPSKWRQP